MQPRSTNANQGPNVLLEEACVEEYLSAHGYTPESVCELPAAAAEALMTSAHRAAVQRLTEIECRSHWLHGIHHHR